MPVKSGWAFTSLALAAGAAHAPLGCSSSSSAPAPTYLDRATMLDPTTCQSCHVDHYAQWAASMHAYASDDPIFQAMNARGQRETQGQLGDFCVKCHAPVALAEGATTDGLNLATVPKSLHGVTCFFCHTINAVTGSHNAAVSLSGDLVMRGEYDDPVQNSAHAAAYDELHDRSRAASAGLCGACHDIDAPPGAHIERTFAEWQSSVYAQPEGDTCGQCHMPKSATTGPIAQVPGLALPSRYTYGHDMPGVDVALPTGPASAQTSVQTFLGTTLQAALCVTQLGAVRVIVDNVAAGHFWPSGATQDRRAWAEVIASKGGTAFYQSGVVPAGTPVTAVQNDPDLWLLRDCMFDATGKQVDMFWQAASVEGNELPAPVTFNPTDPNYYKTHIVQSFPRAIDAALTQMPDKVTLRIRIQPVGLDVLDDLVSTGDLDAGVASAVSTFDVTPLVTWTPETATLTYQEDGQPVACVSPSNLNVAADKTPATNHMSCSP
jgi:nitrate/TMAO reductase-like tetraheme cytochrome c subunit